MEARKLERESSRFRLKGSFRGDIDRGIDTRYKCGSIDIDKHGYMGISIKWGSFKRGLGLL